MFERDVESYLIKRVRFLGGKAIKLAPTEAGVPDRLILWPGGIIHLVEVKADGGVISKAQHRWHEKAVMLGTNVYIVVGKSGVDYYLESVDI